MIDNVFTQTYVQNLNPVTTPSQTFPPDPAVQGEVFDGVSKEVLNLEQLETKLNDINTALTDFESKSNQWHNFLIQSKNETDLDPELFKQYEADQTTTLTSINKIKGLLLQINTQMSVLKDTLKQ